MVGIHETMALLQVEYLIDMTCENQAVATHQILIFGHRRHNLAVVVMHDLDQRAAMDIGQPGLLHGLAHMGVVGGHKQLYRVVGCRLEGRLGRLAVGQEFAHGDDGEHADKEAEQAGDGGGQHVHRRSGAIGIQSGDNQVGGRTDKRTHATHARGIAQRYQQLRR